MRVCTVRPRSMPGFCVGGCSKVCIMLGRWESKREGGLIFTVAELREVETIHKIGSLFSKAGGKMPII